MHVELILRHFHRIWRRQGSPPTSTVSWNGPTVLSSIETATPSLPYFSPPSSCFNSVYTVGSGGSDYFDEVSSIAVRGPSPFCLPSEANGYDVADVTFSPGVCPVGYFTSYEATISQNASITMAACCPQPLTLTTVSSSLLTCTESALGADVVTLINGTQTTTADAKYLQAPAITVMFQSTDRLFLAGVTSTASTASPGATSPSISSTTKTVSTSFPPTQEAPTPTNSSLSTRARVGISVSAAASCVLLLILGIMLRRRRKRRAANAAPVTDETEKAELPGEGVHRELDGNAVLYEANGTGKPPELDNNIRAELETDWAGWEAPAVCEIHLAGLPSERAEETRDHAHAHDGMVGRESIFGRLPE